MSRSAARTLLALLCLTAMAGVPALAQDTDLTPRIHEQDPPEELAQSVRDALSRDSVQLMDGEEPVFEFWLRKEVPLAAKPASAQEALTSVAPGTLLGAVRLPKPARDFRDDRIRAGVYTLRYALQPQDGDHMGTAPVPYFVLLVPAARDSAVDGPGTTDAVVEMTKDEKHPRSLNLRAAPDADGEVPRIEEGFDDTRMVHVKVAGKAGDDAVDLPFAIVFEGHGEL